MKRKILIISPSIEDGSVRGLGKVTQALIEGITKNGCDPILLTGIPLIIRSDEKNHGRNLIQKRALDHYLLEGIRSSMFNNNILKAFLLILIDFISLLMGKRSFLANVDFLQKHSPYELKNYKKVAGTINFYLIYRISQRLPSRIVSFIIYKLANHNGIDTIIASSPFPIKKPLLFNRHTKLIQYAHDVMPLNILETVPSSGNSFLKNITIADKYSDAIIASSDSTKNKINKIFGDNKTELLYLPFEHSIPSISGLNSNNILKHFNLKKGSYIICLSMLESRKNIKRLIEAFALINNKSNLKLLLVGDRGIGYNEIANTYSALPKKIQNNIVFSGFVNEEVKQTLLSGAKFLVHPSIDEGLGIPVIEGILNRKPVLATRLDSIEEFAPEKSVTYIDNPYDSYEIAKHLHYLSTSRSNKTLLNNYAKELHEKFDKDIFSNNLKKYIS